MDKIYIIAEAGVNHNGDFNVAKLMISEAKKAGADAVKFQTFVSKNLVSQYAPKAEYQKKTTSKSETQLEMLQKLELSFDQFIALNNHAKEVGIDFLSTPFDFDSIDFLMKLNMKYWKIPSGEITNKPYLQRIAQTDKPIILSTGMSEISEIEEALAIFRHYLSSNIILLHCNTEYPTPYRDVNLLAMNTLKEHFKVKVGYSDHTEGIEIALAAAALGACVIEKHFTLDKKMSGPDHKASINPVELASMVSCIRNIENALGNGTKVPTQSELKNRTVARKSIVASKDISKGDIYTEKNLSVKRPGDGISPMQWDKVLGTRANRNYKEDEKIEFYE